MPSHAMSAHASPCIDAEAVPRPTNQPSIPPPHPPTHPPLLLALLPPAGRLNRAVTSTGARLAWGGEGGAWKFMMDVWGEARCWAALPKMVKSAGGMGGVGWGGWGGVGWVGWVGGVGGLMMVCVGCVWGGCIRVCGDEREFSTRPIRGTSLRLSTPSLPCTDTLLLSPFQHTPHLLFPPPSHQPSRRAVHAAPPHCCSHAPHR
jgi:hypothetical protein